MSEWNIVWHHRDLRIEDNPALNAAASGKVLPVYIHCPQEEGPWSRGAASNWWLHHSLSDLQKRYKELGTELVIRSGPATEVIKQLASELPTAGVYWNARYEPTLRKRDEAVASDLTQQGISVNRYEGNYLISPSDIMTGAGTPYSVFTPFCKKVIEIRPWRSPLSTSQAFHSHTAKSESLDALRLLPKRDWADQFTDRWQPGRAGALKHLNAFGDEVDNYAEQRDIPSRYGTSRLSPHLHFGEVSPHEIWTALESNSKDPTPYLRQLIWREFGNYFLFHTPLACDHSWRTKFEQFPWEENTGALEAWQTGRTGYPIVDAGMRELWQTGWMHNRVRMIVGSFLVKDLFIHWIEGARWFWDTLVDADLANNTLGWQWVAGCGPDAAPYFRIFNPVLQSKKFDPEGSYIRRWIPELKDTPSKWIHCPWESPMYSPDYPPPIVNHAEARQKALSSYQKIK